MTANICINKILEEFYLSTNLPIQAFDYKEKLVARKGFNKELEKLFDNDIYATIISRALTKDFNKSLEIKYLNDIYFTAYSNSNINNIVFVLGPYSLSKFKMDNIVYKPSHIIKYCISLLSIIIENNVSNADGICDTKPRYSFHIKKAIDYIYLNYDQNITLTTVSNYLGINKSYLASLFKKETGKTFTEMLNEVRIEESKKLLLDTNLSALDIALTVGYNSQNYYNIAFKKFANKTPLEFRYSS